MAKHSGHATLAVLDVLLDRADQEVLDYEIGNGVRGVGPRAVFRVLRRLEQEGWLTSRWDEDRGQRVKYIRLTGLGVLAALQLFGEEDPSAPPSPVFEPPPPDKYSPRFFDQDVS
jgi:DNA-binding PadR family transcriptional regulator